jgi:DNA repair protein RecN (Recombination protein N)
LDLEYEFVNDFMYNLSASIDKCNDKFEILNTYSIEEIINRLDEFSKLKNKYGSIENALKYKEEKVAELSIFKNISTNKKTLIETIKELQKVIDDISIQVSNTRKNNLKNFTREINEYSIRLYLNDLDIDIKDKSLSKNGIDNLSITINKVKYNKLSSGEINRLRLSLIALKNKYSSKKSVLIIDEIDANLSGKESQSIAKLLYEISKNYQILAISHQPHLTSYANMHFLVQKDKKQRTIKQIKNEDRKYEIARMLSGDDISKNSLKLAEEFIKNAQ